MSAIKESLPTQASSPYENSRSTSPFEMLPTCQFPEPTLSFAQIES